MSYSWRTKADVLNDLGSVNGRRTGSENLDRHVVEGERPPPIHHEVPDEDQMSYFGHRHGGPPEDNSGPDLAGISVALRITDNLDESHDNEPLTIYHNKSTDEIMISKLNPMAGEYVPGSFVTSRRQPERKDKGNNYGSYQNTFPMPSSMFRRRQSGKKVEGNISENVDPTKSANNSLNGKPNNVLRSHISHLKTSLLTNGLSRQQSDELEDANDFSTEQEKQDLLPNGLPKRKIEKSPVSDCSSPCKGMSKQDEIKEIQEKVKSSIIASSKDHSLQTKRQKNVAIATLLLKWAAGSVAKEEPVAKERVKLMPPNYFENPPTNINKKSSSSPSKSSVEKEHPSTSSSELDLNIDDDSVSKVNGWFSNMESPKPKPQLPERPVLQPSVTFKKKERASVNSPSSKSSEEAKEPTEETNTFKPSEYANDLLKKYERNAQRIVPLREDLGTMLERRLKERDEMIRQKMLAKQNAG